MRVLLLLLLSCLPCFAQFGVEQPIFASSGPAFRPEDIPGIYAYWDVRDIAYTNAYVTNFNDRIQGMVLTNGDLTLRPRNTDNGLFFGIASAGSPVTMTNTTPFQLSTNTTMFCTVMCTRPDNAMERVYGYAIGAAATHRSLPHFNVATANSQNGDARWGLVVSAASSTPFLAAFEDLQTNSWITIAISEVVGGFVAYTNGVSVGYTNSASATTGVRERMSYIGGATTFNGDGIGYLSQLIFYTNLLTSGQISNLNLFAYKPTVYIDTTNAVLLNYDVGALGYSDGTAISNLPDTGPYSLSLTSSPTASRPYWTNNASSGNNEGFAYFDGSDDYLTNNFTTVYPQPLHVFVVAHSIGIGGVSSAMWAGAFVSGSDWIASWEFNNTDVRSFYAGTQMDLPSFSNDPWIVWETLFYGNNSFVRTNNVLVKSGALGSNGLKGFHLGNNIGLTGPFKGGISWVGVYTNWLSTPTASNLVQSLGTRYGITTYTRN